MRLRPRHRLRIALVAIFCLLFQQLAVAAYACETKAHSPQVPPAHHCAQMAQQPAPQTPPLCEKHCSPDVFTAADHVQLAAPAIALPPSVFTWGAASPVGHRADIGSVPLSRSDPPPRLRFCSLLI